MKLTAIFLFVACITASATGHSQQVTISFTNAPLETVFKELQKQTDYNFIYTSDLLKDAKTVTLNAKNELLAKVLQECFKNQPLTYTIVDKYVVVKRISTPAIQSGATLPEVSLPPPIDISGRVTDPDGNPLVGANVKVKGTSQGTTTDVNGVFVLKGVDDNATLEISYVGFQTLSMPVNNKTAIVASLKMDVQSMNEVVINKGYYTEKQKYSVSNVGKVTSKEIEKQPVNNVLLALQGRVPGLFIEQATGLPGSGIKVRIQGQNSIGRGNDPLYVIDGIPFIMQNLPTLNPILGNPPYYEGSTAGAGNPLSYINPMDIESVEVLKDADATSIYGSRAANGAILITTKAGKTGKTRVDVNFQNGWGKITRMLKLMNTEQYLKMRKQGFMNDGLPVPNGSTAPDPSNYDLTVWDQNMNTDWQKELLGGTARYTDAQLSFSGGTVGTQYMFGCSYHKETTVFPTDFSDVKTSLHFNINNISSNQKLHVQLSGNYMFDNNKLPSTDLTAVALYLAPNAPSLYNADGTLNWGSISSGSSTISTWRNPVASLLSKYNNKTRNIIANSIIGYKVFSRLDIKCSFGYTDLQVNEINTFPITVAPPELRVPAQRSSSFGNGSITSWIIEPQATYKHSIWKGSLEALVGTTFQQNNSNRQQFSATGFNSDNVLADIKSATSVTAGPTIISTYNYNAVFGRINYNVLDKYVLNVSARRDGSSRFGSENLFNNFWSVGGAWIFSKEKSLAKIPFISFGKVKGSYGTTGNDQIGDYQFLNLFANTNTSSQLIPYQGATGLVPRGLPNPYLQWEETRKLQGGIDLGFSSDRLLVSINYVHNRSSNELLPYLLPIITGVSTITKNFPATIQNTGWEFSLNSINIRKNNFVWTTNVNLTIPKNKLIDFPNLATSSYANDLVIGKPITIVRVYHYAGVDPARGFYQFYSKNGDITANPNDPDDRTVILDLSPKFYGGFQNNFRYKGIELDFLFQFVKQIGNNYFFGNRPGLFDITAIANQPTTVLHPWQKTNDVTNIQRYSATYPSSLLSTYLNAVSSDAAWTDASYVRLKNVSLAWKIPTKWERKIHLQNCRLYAQGQNLLTITNYQGIDPENRSIGSLAPLKVFTVGVRLSL